MKINCGTDIIEVKRIKNAVEKWGKGFLKRIFTQQEIDYSLHRSFCFEHLSARFAAKEAVFKAFGTGFSSADFKNVEIVNDQRGRPYVILKGNMKFLFGKLFAEQLTISMSHTQSLAQAVAILVVKDV
ncbi:MAG: holo-[acyl-carrier-protein] synthase [Candidatus Omnitrophota bacterium]|nr:MAG: holo-[acyl-carrier-protein] synthase [Candidatus Omnitrophota bacterium]